MRFARAQHASPDQPLRLLDVACGTGHLLRMLGAALPNQAKFFGVDLSPQYIARAREILGELSQSGRAPVSAEAPGGLESAQLGLFPSAPDPVLKELLALELSTLTPLQALNLLHEWQQRLRSQP